MWPVAEINFEEVGIEAENGQFIGMFSGVASITADGEVVALAIDTHAKSWVDIDVPVTTTTDFMGTLARYLAQAIERQYAHVISDELDAWELDRRSGHREYNADERGYF